MGFGSLSRGQCGRRMALTSPLVPKSKKEQNYTSTSNWAFMASTRVNFTFIIGLYIYRVIHNSLRDFRPLRYSSRDGHAEGEHVN